MKTIILNNKLVMNSDSPKDKKILNQIKEELTKSDIKHGSISVHNNLIELVIPLGKF